MTNAAPQPAAIALLEISPAGFAPFGPVVSADRLAFPQFDDGAPTVQLFEMTDTVCLELASHMSYDQVFIGAVGTAALLVAPQRQSSGHIRVEEITGFALRPGQAVMISRGILHNIVATDAGPARFATIRRAHPGEQDGRPITRAPVGAVPAGVVVTDIVDASGAATGAIGTLKGSGRQ
jgi:ureidoglycolate hydrolase